MNLHKVTDIVAGILDGETVVNDLSLERPSSD